MEEEESDPGSSPAFQWSRAVTSASWAREGSTAWAAAPEPPWKNQAEETESACDRSPAARDLSWRAVRMRDCGSSGPHRPRGSIARGTERRRYTLAFQVGRMWLRSPEDEGGGKSSTTDRRGESPCRRVGAGRLPCQPECRGGPAVPIDHRSSAGRRGLSTGEARGFPSTGRPSRASAGRLAFLPRVRGGRP